MNELKKEIFKRLKKTKQIWATCDLATSLNEDLETVSDCLVKLLDKGEVEEVIYTKNQCGLGKTYICFWAVPGVFNEITKDW